MATTLQTATTNALIKAGPRTLKSVIIAAGADVATVTITDTTDGTGTTLLVMTAAANTTSPQWVTPDSEGPLFSVGIHAKITGTSPVATIEYE